MTTALAQPPAVSTSVLRLVDPVVDEAELSVEDLGSRIVGLAGRLAAATCQWLLLVARFDAREGCARFGLASTARWLTHACGLSRRAAVEHVRVARALAAYPALAASMSAGRLSYSHVRAIARVAKPGEERTVTDLIEVAESGTVGQLETIVRGLRAVEDLDDGQDTPPPQYVRSGWASNSQWQLSARLDPERGALVSKAIEAMSAAEGITAVEALERIAEVALAVLNGAGRAPELRGDERAAVIVHLDLSAARAAVGRPADRAADAAPPDTGETDRGRPDVRRWRARIADGPGVPDSVIERLVCEGRLRTALFGKDGTMFDLGRTRRVVSRRLFRALLHRDGGCSHPGCGSRDGLEAHHVRHWLHGGRTDLANLVLLCRWHHHSHHRDEFSIGIGAEGAFVFRRPDGRILDAHVDPARLMPAGRGLPDTGSDTGSGAARWTGTGQRLDRRWAIDVLAQRREDARSAIRSAGVLPTHSLRP